MLATFLTILHVVTCIFLIIVVLLQHGKSADIAGAFGGVGSQTAFGPRGAASALSKATTIAVVVFMLTSLSLSVVSKRGPGGGSSVMEGAKPTQNQPAQQAPPPPAPTPAPTNK